LERFFYSHPGSPAQCAGGARQRAVQDLQGIHRLRQEELRHTPLRQWWRGQQGQLNVEMLKVSTGVFITHIPYRGNMQAVPFFKPDWPLGLMQKAPAAIKNEVVNRSEDAMGKWRP
jgi:hypothetical protein